MMIESKKEAISEAVVSKKRRIHLQIPLHLTQSREKVKDRVAGGVVFEGETTIVSKKSLKKKRPQRKEGVSESFCR